MLVSEGSDPDKEGVSEPELAKQDVIIMPITKKNGIFFTLKLRCVGKATSLGCHQTFWVGIGFGVAGKVNAPE